jgi:hypothetical protein
MENTMTRSLFQTVVFLVRLSLIFVQRGEFTGVGQNDDINVD